MGKLNLLSPVMRWLLLICVPLLIACGQRADDSPNDARETLQEVLPARQFDFWVGTWRVTNRFLQDDGTWQDDGEAVDKIYSILDGKAILEFWDGEARRGPLRGFSLRYFDPASERWILVLNWPGPNRPRFFQLDGQFRHGRGAFFRRRTDSTGTEILSRYTFSDVTPTSLRWDAAYSLNEGTTWRTNWIMEFTRTADTAPWPDPGTPFPTYEDGSLCTEDEADAFDALEGRWTGSYSYRHGGAWTTTEARMQAHRVLNGCAVFNLTEYEMESTSHKLFQIRSYLPQREEWVTLQLDNQPRTGHTYLAGRFRGETITLVERPPDDSETTSHRKIVWTQIGDEQLRYERADSSAGAAGWTTTARIQLEKE